MNVYYMCGGELVNKHGEDGYGTDNPFGKIIPSVGDFVQLGGHAKELDKYRKENKECTYKVVSRTFKALETYNNMYTERTCVVELEKME